MGKIYAIEFMDGEENNRIRYIKANNCDEAVNILNKTENVKRPKCRDKLDGRKTRYK